MKIVEKIVISMKNRIVLNNMKPGIINMPIGVPALYLLKSANGYIPRTIAMQPPIAAPPAMI